MLRMPATGGRMIVAVSAGFLLSGCGVPKTVEVRVIEITATPYVITATPEPSPTPISPTPTPVGVVGIDRPVDMYVMGFPFSVKFTRAEVTKELSLAGLTGAPLRYEAKPGFKLLVLWGECAASACDANAGQMMGNWANIVDENGDAYGGTHVQHMRGRSEDIVEWIWLYGVGEASMEFTLVVPGGVEVDLSRIVVVEE